MPPQADLDALIALVQRGAHGKYAHIAPSFVRRIVQREAVPGRTSAEIARAARGKLHQVVESYLIGKSRHDTWLAAAASASASQNEAELRAACRGMMGHHASTRDRLPWIDHFYQTLLRDLPPITSVLDVACGLHPLAIPWMSLATGARYIACDVEANLLAIVQDWLPLWQIGGEVILADVTRGLPSETVDVAFVLKVLPCLEQVEQGSGRALLDHISARTIFVSYPTTSLTGRQRGMARTYTAQFERLMAGRPGRSERIVFPNEIVFKITGDHAG